MTIRQLLRFHHDLRVLVVNTLAGSRRKIPRPHLAQATPLMASPSCSTAQLSINQDGGVLQRIGCPCLEFKLVCRAAARPKSLGHSSTSAGPISLRPSSGHSARISATVPASFSSSRSPISSWAFCRRRSRTRRMASSSSKTTYGNFFRSRRQRLLYFAEAPPEDVFLTVKHLDGRRETSCRVSTCKGGFRP